MIQLDIATGIALSPNHPVKYWKFPGGEVGVQIQDTEFITDSSYACIYVNGIMDSQEFMQLLNLLDALWHLRVKKENIHLTLPYFPYARQDRVCHQGESAALAMFIRQLFTGLFGQLTVWDLHSKVSEDALQMACKLYDVAFFHVKQEIFSNMLYFDWYIFPDAGAKAKSNNSLHAEDRKIILNKQRIGSDVVYMYEPFDKYSGHAIVLDDICDGGRTFVSLGQMLKETQPNLKLSLYVTHGIFSAGLDKLGEIYDTIYTPNLMNAALEHHPKIQHI